MLAAVLTVSGPWLPARWRRWWWALLLAFVPIHLVISAVVPARSLFGLAVGWFIGALVVLVVGTPGLDVPLEGAVRAMARRGCVVSALKVVRPSGAGPLILQAECEHQQTTAVMEMYGPHQRGGGVLAAAVAQGAVARPRDRAPARIDAPRRRTPGADGHRDRSTQDRQHLDGRRGRARAQLDVVRPHSRPRNADRRLHRGHSREPGLGIVARTSRLPDLARGSARQRDHRRRDRVVRRLRQRRIRRDRRATAVRYRAAAGDDDPPLRCAVRGAGRDRRVRQGHRAVRIASAHESGCPVTYPPIRAEPEGGHLRRARRGEEPDARRRDPHRDRHPVHPRPAASSSCC